MIYILWSLDLVSKKNCWWVGGRQQWLVWPIQRRFLKKIASDLVNYAFVGSMKRYFTWGRFLEMEHSILQYSIQRLPVTQTLYSLLFLFSASLSCISGNCRCLDGGVTCRYNIYIYLAGLGLHYSRHKKLSKPETDPLFRFYDTTVSPLL